MFNYLSYPFRRQALIPAHPGTLEAKKVLADHQFGADCSQLHNRRDEQPCAGHLQIGRTADALDLHGRIRNVWSFLRRGGSDELELARTLADAMKYNKDTGADECEVREKILAGLTRELGENHPATRRARE